MTTLYEKLGGKQGLEPMVDAFYEKVLVDPLLKPFFENVAMKKLAKMQVAFFTIALGGPLPDTDISLYEAHQGRGIGVKHLTRFSEHLMATLRDVGVQDEDAKKVYERIATYSNDVLGESSVDG